MVFEWLQRGLERDYKSLWTDYEWKYGYYVERADYKYIKCHRYFQYYEICFQIFGEQKEGKADCYLGAD